MGLHLAARLACDQLTKSARLFLLQSVQFSTVSVTRPADSCAMSTTHREDAKDERFMRPKTEENTSSSSSRPLLMTFDAFDTLFTPKDTVFDQYSQVAARHGVQARPADVRVDFVQAYKQVSAENPNYGKATGMSPDVWYNLIIDASFPSSRYPDLEDATRRIIKTELFQRFATCEGYHLFPDVIPFLRHVGDPTSTWAPRHTMLGIISNTDPRVRGILESFNILTRPALYPRNDAVLRPAHIAFATLSYEAGVEKPDPRIFQHALQDAQSVLSSVAETGELYSSFRGRHAVIATEFRHIHVGDDLIKDTLAAKRAGWDGVWLDRSSDKPIREVLVDASGQILADQASPAAASDSISAQQNDVFRLMAINSLASLQDVVS